MDADFRGRSGWGNNSLSFSLPFARVRFNSLSQEQSDSLNDTFAEFVVDADPASVHAPLPLDCFVYRLPRAPDISSDSLTINGQYAPRKVHRDGGIDLTGINFKARIHSKHSPSPSLLGVAEEHELAQANVVENFLRVLAAHNALEQGGVLLHSAGLVVDNRAYIFCGKSGSGKTTLTRKAFKSGARVLSDDINLLMPGDELSYLAHPVPFSGEFGRTLTQNEGQDSYPLVCIALLEQGSRLKTSRFRNSMAVARLLTNCPFVNTDANESEKLFDVVADLVERTPVMRLQSHIDDPVNSIFQSVRRAMGYD